MNRDQKTVIADRPLSLEKAPPSVPLGELIRARPHRPPKTKRRNEENPVSPRSNPVQEVPVAEASNQPSGDRQHSPRVRLFHQGGRETAMAACFALSFALFFGLLAFQDYGVFWVPFVSCATTGFAVTLFAHLLARDMVRIKNSSVGLRVRKGRWVFFRDIFYCCAVFVLTIMFFGELVDWFEAIRVFDKNTITKTYAVMILVTSASLLMTLFQAGVASVARFHDMNISGWWTVSILALVFFPWLLLGVVVVLLCVPGSKGDNRYGKRPSHREVRL